jgi:26S proteasome regulatory subunit N2
LIVSGQKFLTVFRKCNFKLLFSTFSEALYDDTTFPHRQEAALLLSKVYYYLGEHAESLKFALGAGSQFNFHERSDFVESIFSKLIGQ